MEQSEQKIGNPVSTAAIIYHKYLLFSDMFPSRAGKQRINYGKCSKMSLAINELQRIPNVRVV